jgi:ribonuclease-3
LCEGHFYTIAKKILKGNLPMAQDIESLVRANKQELAELEKAVGYRFTDLRLLQNAVVHSSYAFEQGLVVGSNERLEYLGDAVLDLVVGHLLFKRYPRLQEGELSKLRASLVNEQHLAKMAREIDLGRYLALGKGEDSSQGRSKSSILSCAYEAVLGAMFEDGGYTAVVEVVGRLFATEIDGKKEELLIGDAKSRLQEVLQEKYNQAPTYRIEAEDGPSHQRQFTAAVCFQERVLGTGQASSKKEAEQRAAAAALEAIRDPEG